VWYHPQHGAEGSIFPGVPRTEWYKKDCLLCAIERVLILSGPPSPALLSPLGAAEWRPFFIALGNSDTLVVSAVG